MQMIWLTPRCDQRYLGNSPFLMSHDHISVSECFLSDVIPVPEQNVQDLVKNCVYVNQSC